MVFLFVSEVKHLYQPIKVTLNEGKLEVLIVRLDFVFAKSNMCLVIYFYFLFYR